MIYKTDKESDNIGREYPYVTKGDSLHNKIIRKKIGDFKHMRHPPDDLYAKLDNGKKIHIWAKYYEKNTQKGIDELVFPGDSLVKHAGSDTVYVYKQNSKSERFDYFFIIHTEN